MPNLFNRNITIAEIRERVGDLSQVAGIRRMTLADGKEAGVRMAEVRTGSGLRYQVTLDRGMDISMADFKGLPLSWRSAQGDVHPAYFDPTGTGWANSFAGGLLTGCGMTYLGSPCTDRGEELGLHGRLSNTPAEDVTVQEAPESGAWQFEISGTMREISLFGYHLALRRTIRSELGRSALYLSDRVRNEGPESAPFMMLYHINLGWPLLDTGSRLFLDCEKTIPRDIPAREGMNTHRTFEEPYVKYDEQVFYHDVRADRNGYAHAMLVNRELALALHVRYRKLELPQMVQWKMLLRGYYVLGIEPANCLVEGRAQERERGTLRFLEPGEEVHHELSLYVHEGNDTIDELLREYRLR
jgi:hypothetical protein